jgi:hypothetical protein
MTLSQDNHVVQAFPADRRNHPFSVSIMPRRARSGYHLLDAEHLCLSLKNLSLDRVAITDQVPRVLIPSVGVQELSSGPLGRWKFGNVEVQDLSPIIAEHYEHK